MKKILFLGCLFSMQAVVAQNWLTTGNSGLTNVNFLGTTDTKALIFKTNNIERGRLVAGNGGWRFGTATDFAKVDSSGTLTFGGNGVYRVGPNKYAFQYTLDNDYGLFFNATGAQYEFRNSLAAPIFSVGADNGNGVFAGTLTVGNYTLPSTDGTSGQILRTNGAGVLSFSDPGAWGVNGNAGTSPVTNFIGSSDAADVVFRTSNLERLRIKADGKLGLGTSTPTAKLHINSAAAEDALRIQTNGTTRLFVDDAGGVSVGSTAGGPTGGLFVSGSTGMGTNLPEAKLHIMNLSAGLVTANSDAVLVVENNTSNYINMLTPDNNEKGILFGDVSNASDGGILYNALNSMQFRTNGNVTRMTLNSLGDLFVTGDLDVGGSTVGFGSVEQLSDIGSNLIGCNSDFVTTTDGVNSLGSSANTWFDVWATDATINTSDAKEKTNIRNLDYGLKEIMQLRAVKYNWKKWPEAGNKIGVIAQEVQKILPEAVRDWEFKKDEATGKQVKQPTEKLGVIYDEFIPVLIRGMQQQQDMINELKKQNDLLQQQIDELKNSSSVQNSGTISGELKTIALTNAALEQNIPNPFTNATTIRYTLPATFTQARIVVVDKNGKAIKEVDISGSGKNTLQLDASLLTSGAYSYSLFINGKMIDTKQMILAR